VHVPLAEGAVLGCDILFWGFMSPLTTMVPYPDYGWRQVLLTVNIAVEPDDRGVGTRTIDASDTL